MLYQSELQYPSHVKQGEAEKSLSQRSYNNLKKKLTKTYLILGERLIHEYSLAKEKNLKFIILIGERHCQAYCILIEIMIILLCRHFNLKNVCLELDKERYDSDRTIPARIINTLFHIIHERPNLRAESSIIIEEIVTSIRGKIHLVDTAKTNDPHSDEGMKIRNEVMAHEMTKLNDNSILIVGAHHLYGLMNETLLNKLFHVFPISLYKENYSLQHSTISPNDQPSSREIIEKYNNQLNKKEKILFVQQEDIHGVNFNVLIEMLKEIQEENLYTFVKPKDKKMHEELALKELALKELALKELALKELALKELALKELALKELALKLQDEEYRQSINPLPPITYRRQGASSYQNEEKEDQSSKRKRSESPCILC